MTNPPNDMTKAVQQLALQLYEDAQRSIGTNEFVFSWERRIEDQLTAARNEGLEMAAQWHDRQAKYIRSAQSDNYAYERRSIEHDEDAEEIRALKLKQTRG